MGEDSVDRRRFLRDGCLAAAALTALAPASASAQTPPSPPSMPPPLAPDTWAKRQQQARARLKQVGAAGLIEIAGGGLTYLTGLPLVPSDKLVLFLLPAEGPTFLLGRAEEREIAQTPSGRIEEIHLCEEEEIPLYFLEKALKKRELTQGRLAVSPAIRYEDFVAINTTLPKLTFVSSGPILSRQRQSKGGDEMALIQAASAIAAWAIERVLPEIREGMAEDELTFRVESAIREAGARAEARVVSGGHGSDPSATPSRRRLAAGDVVLLDACASVQGCHGAVTRTAILGRATGRMKLIHETIRKAQEFVRERARADVRAAVLDQLSRSALGGRGFLPEVRLRVGEGIGLEPQEEPWLSVSVSEPIPAGAIATIGPAVFTPGEYGIRARDVLEFTETGGRWLTTPPEGIRELG